MKKNYHSPQLTQLPECPRCASMREPLEQLLKMWNWEADEADRRCEFWYAIKVREHIKEIQTIFTPNRSRPGRD